MDETEATQKDYQMLMGRNPFNFPYGPDYPTEGVTLYDAVLYANKRSEFEGLNPVYSYSDVTYSADGKICIGLPGLAADLRRNGYRLQTSMEWKRAYLADGGDPRYYWTYTTDNNEISKYARFNYNSGTSSHQVARKIPNNWGLYDMGGNVLEWTWEEPDPPYYSFRPPQMGGSWADSPFYLKADSFFRGSAGEPCAHGGFRLVRKGPNVLVPTILTPLLLQ